MLMGRLIVRRLLSLSQKHGGSKVLLCLLSSNSHLDYISVRRLRRLLLLLFYFYGRGIYVLNIDCSLDENESFFLNM